MNARFSSDTARCGKLSESTFEDPKFTVAPFKLAIAVDISRSILLFSSALFSAFHRRPCKP